ncbi:sodium/hydrogen exchanger 10 [Carlito syrichta]|uniref:Solute carrier family 9 member C1 n=1 Tax=Carlito syrichta TaxID=1868482 RepID=A0A1U7U3W1_CARSF|nr:sodium/hydrogen exchanger 10 [Carlito syrichta]
MELAKRHLLSAQIASYQRQYRNETLSQSAVKILVGAAGSSGEKEEYMSLETIKNYSESKKVIIFIRKRVLHWVYNTKKEKGISSRHLFLRVCHNIVFTDEFEALGYLVTLMNIYPIIISWIPQLHKIYDSELERVYYFFLAFYTIESLLKIGAMKKEFFSHTWNLFEFVITIIDIFSIMLLKTNIFESFNMIQTVIFIKTVRLCRILRILKLITPKLLEIIDKSLSHQRSFTYAILKGYVQGEADVMTVIDQITSSEQIKQILLKRITKNMEDALKELGYFECDHPEIAITVKTKQEIDVMLNMAKEIVKVFESKGIIHKTEGAKINKFIMAKKKEVLGFQSVIPPLTVQEIIYHIPWLDKDKDHINFIQEKVKVIAFDCGNEIFQEDDEPRGIYIVVSGMIKLTSSKPRLGIDQILESEEKNHPIIHKDYVLSGEIIGEINCFTNEPMQYSASCKTVAEMCFISKNHLYEALEQCCPLIEQKVWQKIGLAITARKIREHLSYEDWNYNMQLKLSNTYIKDIPKSTKTDICYENVIYVILIHGAVKDCQLQKVYKAPFLIPKTCQQIQGNEEFTKVMIVQASINTKNIRLNAGNYVSKHKGSLSLRSMALNGTLGEDIKEKQELRRMEHTVLPLLGVPTLAPCSADQILPAIFNKCDPFDLSPISISKLESLQKDLKISSRILRSKGTPRRNVRESPGGCLRFFNVIRSTSLPKIQTEARVHLPFM